MNKRQSNPKISSQPNLPQPRIRQPLIGLDADIAALSALQRKAEALITAVKTDYASRD